jgi:glutamate dehydrogenase
VATRAQIDILVEITGLIEQAAAWLLRHRRLDLGGEIARLGPRVRCLAAGLAELLPERDKITVAERTLRLREASVPEAIAARLARLSFLASALDIDNLAQGSAQPLDMAARVYFGVADRLALDEMRAAARRLPADTPWQKLAVEATVDDLFALQADLAARILASGCAAQSDPLAAWAASRAGALATADTVARELRGAVSPDLAMLVVASRQLRQTLG